MRVRVCSRSSVRLRGQLSDEVEPRQDAVPGQQGHRALHGLGGDALANELDQARAAALHTQADGEATGPGHQRDIGFGEADAGVAVPLDGQAALDHQLAELPQPLAVAGEGVLEETHETDAVGAPEVLHLGDDTLGGELAGVALVKAGAVAEGAASGAATRGVRVTFPSRRLRRPGARPGRAGCPDYVRTGRGGLMTTSPSCLKASPLISPKAGLPPPDGIPAPAGCLPPGR